MKKTEARKIRVKAPRFEMVDGKLYRKSYLMPLLRCLELGEAKEVLKDIHYGLCGNHVGSRNLARKAVLAGYYWPTMFQDSEELVRTCLQCQVHAPVIKHSLFIYPTHAMCHFLSQPFFYMKIKTIHSIFVHFMMDHDEADYRMSRLTRLPAYLMSWLSLRRLG